MASDFKKEINDLKKKVAVLESLNLRNHRHSGLGSEKVKFQDIHKVIYAEATIDPGSLVDGSGETQSVTVEGANLGDFVLVSAPYDLEDITVTGYVQAQDTIEIRLVQRNGNNARYCCYINWNCHRSCLLD